jgi:hypothetical protein
MKIKLKRATRTPHSEQVLIYDFDNLDAEGKPVQIGQMDVHYVEDQVVGTLLIAQEFAEGTIRLYGAQAGQAALDNMISEVLAEVSEPVGVSGTYAFEVYYTPFASHGFFSNYGDTEDQEGVAATVGEAGLDYEMEGAEYSEEPGAGAQPGVPPTPNPYAPREDDDFSRRLRER